MNTILLLFCIAVTACEGGETRPGMDCTNVDIPGCPDVFPPDAAVSCNPVSQAGCDAGEKCALLVESAEPFLARTDCVPAGAVTEGGACTRGEAGAATGFDDCIGGYDCTHGVCTEICDVGSPDGCRADGEGSYCALYASDFTDGIGVCVAGCIPVDDTVTDGIVKNSSCAAGEGCYLNATHGVAACANTPVDAAEATQNSDCYGPASGGCYLNGCASGFAALLNNKPEDADGTVCARYCSPTDTHTDAPNGASGVSGNCSAAAMKATGGTNGVQSEHQCRFIQTFSHEANLVDATVGMCVPINLGNGATWSDCSEFFWEDIKTVWSDALAAGTDPQTAFNDFCLVDPTDPDNSPLRDACVGLARGCIRSLEIETGLPGFDLALGSKPRTKQ
jgi:hypothetical protein